MAVGAVVSREYVVETLVQDKRGSGKMLFREFGAWQTYVTVGTMEEARTYKRQVTKALPGTGVRIVRITKEVMR